MSRRGPGLFKRISLVNASMSASPALNNVTPAVARSAAFTRAAEGVGGVGLPRSQGVVVGLRESHVDS